MSRRSDFSYEMPGELPLDDALAPFAEEVRFAVSGPPPVPTQALASVLAGGFSNPSEKGDLLVTAASNVHGPASQAAGLPKWKEEKDMPVTGVSAGSLAELGAALLAKLSGVGTAAKAAVASVTAVTTMGLAGGAAGLLPGPAQTLVASAVGAATPFEFPNPADDVAATVEHAVGALPAVTVPPITVPPLPVAPPVSVAASAKAGSTSASASTSSSGAAPAVTPTLPSIPGVPTLPQVTVPPAVASLVNGLPACVRNLVPTNGTPPNPAQLSSQIPACISQVLSTASLPPQVRTCVSSILGAIGGASGMSPTAVPNIASLNVSSCVPMDQSACVNSMMNLLASIPGFGSIPGLSSLPGLSNLTGCVPMNVTTCINSITSAVQAGTTPRLDLSACMPTTLPTPGLPGAGSLPGVGSLPGLSGALPFFGR